MTQHSKDAFLHKLIYGFRGIPIKIPGRLFFGDLDKVVLKFLQKSQCSRIAKPISKHNKMKEIVLPLFMPLLSIIIKNVDIGHGTDTQIN